MGEKQDRSASGEDFSSQEHHGATKINSSQKVTNKENRRRTGIEPISTKIKLEKGGGKRRRHQEILKKTIERERQYFGFK